MKRKDILRRLLAGFYVLQFSVLLLWLTRYSYRAKELLVCWLLFCSFFAVLALTFLGAVLAHHAGQNLVQWTRVALTVIPELAVRLERIPQEAIAGPRIPATGTLKVAAGPYAALSTLDIHSYPLIEIVPPVEGNVPK